MADAQRVIGIVGARGYVGSVLIGLIAGHPGFRLGYVASRGKAGSAVEIPGADGLVYDDAGVETVAGWDADAVILATPDGAAGAYAAALGDRVVVDLSSDHRFDDGWVYGLSEHAGERLVGAKRISNPGCYATAVQLAARPVLGLVAGELHAFGVSGYSGAGTTPSERNDVDRLRGGVTPYKLVDHTHEREVTRHLGRGVRFTPSVGAFFRGITVVVQGRAESTTSVAEISGLIEGAYAGCGLVRVIDGVPRVQDVVGTPGAMLGGVQVGADGTSFAVVSVIDNLMKGAASQAVQNLNLAFGFERDRSLLGAGEAVGA